MQLIDERAHEAAERASESAPAAPSYVPPAPVLSEESDPFPAQPAVRPVVGRINATAATVSSSRTEPPAPLRRAQTTPLPAHQPALLRDTIPPGVRPGQTCHVRPPAGGMLAVVVPAGLGPGKELDVVSPAPAGAADPTGSALQQRLAVTVPPGATGGQLILVNTPRGLLQATVPHGVPPGGMFFIHSTFAPPAAATRLVQPAAAASAVPTSPATPSAAPPREPQRPLSELLVDLGVSREEAAYAITSLSLSERGWTESDVPAAFDAIEDRRRAIDATSHAAAVENAAAAAAAAAAAPAAAVTAVGTAVGAPHAGATPVVGELVSIAQIEPRVT